MGEKLAILVVDDEVDNLKALERLLRPHYEVTVTASAKEALEKLTQKVYSVIISDQRMPEMLGTELLSRSQQIDPLVTRVILTAHTETAEMLDAINRAEIFRYIIKPWDNAELLAAIKQAAQHSELLRANQRLIRELESKQTNLIKSEERLKALNESLEGLVTERTIALQQANEKLNELAMTDSLTGIWNRRALFQRMAEELERSRRYNHQLVVAMVDVDHFKKLNDEAGHLSGDEVLKDIAEMLGGSLRKTDTLGRYGGEEFMILMPETTLADGAEICDRLRQTIEKKLSDPSAPTAVKITVSIGVAGFPAAGSDVEALVRQADLALYEAKANGRNQVVTWKKHASISVS